MDDFMMLKYLKSKGIADHSGHYSRRDGMRNDRMYRYDSYRDDDYGYGYEDDMYRMRNFRYDSRMEIDEYTAKNIVSEMYHYEKDRKHVGEKFSMNKAREVYDKCRHSLPHDITEMEVYIAINAQYHDYAELYKNWFGDNIDQKIIDSAMTFWFKDADAKHENKVANYFNL